MHCSFSWLSCGYVMQLGKITREEIEKELMSTGLSSEAIKGIVEVLSIKSLSELEGWFSSGFLYYLLTYFVLGVLCAVRSLLHENRLWSNICCLIFKFSLDYSETFSSQRNTSYLVLSMIWGIYLPSIHV